MKILFIISLLLIGCTKCPKCLRSEAYYDKVNKDIKVKCVEYEEE